jgi:hypothetical protein
MLELKRFFHATFNYMHYPNVHKFNNTISPDAISFLLSKRFIVKLIVGLLSFNNLTWNLIF